MAEWISAGVAEVFAGNSREAVRTLQARSFNGRTIEKILYIH
jgi:hypothetical protein